jgi:membrane protease YdiL (CAAX protease family)
MKRLFKVFNSILPPDRAQLLFLASLVCLTIAPRLRWTPAARDFEATSGGRAFESVRSLLYEWNVFLSLAVVLLLLAAFAGYWTAFWPGKRPLRRIVCSVMVPVAVVMGVAAGLWTYLMAAPASLFEAHNWFEFWASRFFKNVWILGPGFGCCLFGIILAGIFLILMLVGKTSLPLRLRRTGGNESGENLAWRPVQRLVWALLGPQALVLSALSILVYLVYYIANWINPSGNSFLSGQLNPILELVVLIGVAITTVGRKATAAAWRSIRLEQPSFAFLGLIFPVLISTLILVAIYLPQRAHWAAQSFGRFRPPAFFPDDLRFKWAWLLMALGALGEEVVFRGILQPSFVQRYGLPRGLALVGVIWGAFHFPNDRYSSSSDWLVLAGLFVRLAGCLAIGLVLSWLTLRSGSILPATLAHSLSNILIYTEFIRAPFGELQWIGFWALLAYVLFTRFPLMGQASAQAVDEPQEMEPGVESAP